MTGTLTQEALLDLIERYANATADVLTTPTASYAEASRKRSTVYAALLDAVRSLPIEVGR